ncbi:hypothetical protein CE195_10075 [Sodalis-like symbiont of Philaenus spumarius]|nr:hypothetical protein CE195_10075 [Sodalis-like symbiont of Philaenus spumarius]
MAADKAYDTNAIFTTLSLDERLYASRNLIERCFCCIKKFRRVVTRYDKLSERCVSFVALTAVFIWLCKLSTVPGIRVLWKNRVRRSRIRYSTVYRLQHMFAGWNLTVHDNIAFIAKQMGPLTTQC